MWVQKQDGQSLSNTYSYNNGCINIPLLKDSQSVTIIMNYSALHMDAQEMDQGLKEDRGHSIMGSRFIYIISLFSSLPFYPFLWLNCAVLLYVRTKKLHCRSVNWFDHREIRIQLSHYSGSCAQRGTIPMRKNVQESSEWRTGCQFWHSYCLKVEGNTVWRGILNSKAFTADFHLCFAAILSLFFKKEVSQPQSDERESLQLSPH